MATVVTLRRCTKLVGSNEYQITEIVDGQQRLTTLIILLKAIERRLDRSERSQRRMADELTDLLIIPESASLLLLQTNHDTSQFFANYLHTGVRPEPHETKTLADRELVAAMVECEQFVADWQGSVPELLALLKNRLAFVLYEIEDESAAYTTFEVLNSRGLEVSWLDRLKSALMGAAFELKVATKMEMINQLHQVWADIYRCVGLRQGMSTEALRFAATLKAAEAPSKPLGEQDAVESLLTNAQTSTKILDVARWLLAVTTACDALAAKRRLNAVTRISQARLLAAALNSHSELDATQRDNLLQLWEKVTFRLYGLLDFDARYQVSAYVKLAWRIINKADEMPYSKIAEEMSKIGAKWSIS